MHSGKVHTILIAIMFPLAKMYEKNMKYEKYEGVE